MRPQLKACTRETLVAAGLGFGRAVRRAQAANQTTAPCRSRHLARAEAPVDWLIQFPGPAAPAGNPPIIPAKLWNQVFRLK